MDTLGKCRECGEVFIWELTKPREKQNCPYCGSNRWFDITKLPPDEQEENED